MPEEPTQKKAELLAEERLINELKGGSKEALAAIYDRHAAALLGVIAGIVKDPSRQEEVLQSTFAFLWKNREDYDSTKCRLFTCLLQIARGRAIDVARVDSLMDDDLKENTLEKTEDSSEALELACFEGYSLSRLTEKLNVSPADLKVLIRSQLKNFSNKRNG